MAKQRLEEIRKIRLERVKKLRELGVDPYPARLKGKRQDIKDARKEKGETVTVAGRLMGWRGHGDSVFADLRDQSGEIQLFFQKKTLGEKFKLLKLFDVGDFLLATGEVIKTRAGELTVDVSDYQFLSAPGVALQSTISTSDSVAPPPPL